MPNVSIIIPAYNQSEYLGEAIQSALDQTYLDLEIIVVNDGSTDQTEQVVGQFSDRRIRYLSQANQGLPAARNSGLRSASGDYVTFLDADDLFPPEKLDQQLAVFENDAQSGMVAGQTLMIDIAGRPLGPATSEMRLDDPAQLLLGNRFTVGGILARREWIEKADCFDESLKACEDWDLWLRLALAGCVITTMPQAVYRYRVHPGQMTRSAERMRTAMLAVLDKLFGRSDLPESWRALRDEAYAAAYIRAAGRAYHADLLKMAKGDISRAVRLDPRLLDHQGSQLLDLLAGWACAPMVKDPLAYLEKVYRNLPEELSMLGKTRADRLSALALDIAYRQAQSKNAAQSRYYFMRAARYQPRLLANRGILAALVRF